MPKASFPPLSGQRLVRIKTQTLRLRTTVGIVAIEAAYGQDPASGDWLSPMRRRWGLSARQEMSPELEDRLCYTAAMADSYEAAAKLAAKWGVSVEDATIHHHVEQVGERAEALQQQRVERALEPTTRAEVVAEAAQAAGSREFSLVIELDGWMIRERGDEWGCKPPEIKAERVAWHELKTGVIFRLEDRAQTAGGRRLLIEKYHVAWRGEMGEFGRRVQAEALRRGLCRAKVVYVVADGGVWIWNLVEDRLGGSVGVLDFYHASQHLWAVAHELYGEGPEAAAWVGPLVHQLRHGEAGRVVDSLEGLLQPEQALDKAAGEVVQRELKYFDHHRQHLHYPEVKAQGCPIGSGAVESTCSQLQDRFKRAGQFWSRPGEGHLLALELARRNDDWDELWSISP